MTTNKGVRDEALKFLKDNKVLVLATSFESQPGAAALYYVAEDDFSLYFITKRNSTKFKDMQMNPRVAFVVGGGPSYISIQAKGTVEHAAGGELEPVLKRFRALDTGHSPKDWPTQSLDELKEGGSAIFKIIPFELKFMNLNDERYPKSLGTEHHKIISK